METLLRPMSGKEFRLFVTCLAISVLAHTALVLAVSGGFWSSGGGEAETSRLAERFAQAVNAATDLDQEQRNTLEKDLSQVAAKGWTMAEMPGTLQWLADGAGLTVRDCDVVRSLDSERSREGRMDIRLWLSWGKEAGPDELLILAFLVGEGTLQSDFGSHRFWIHLEGDDGLGRVGLETLDCRLYRSGKISGSDLLHRSQWFDH